MRKKRKQVTCLCGSYEFPHRISGGKCSGSSWAESYKLLIGHLCQMCNCNNPEEGTCDVASELEDIDYCEGYHDHLRKQPDIRLPKHIEEIIKVLIGRRQ